MSKPIRIQRKRASGWKMPPNTIYVGRPTIFGNPWAVKELKVSGLFKPDGVPGVCVSEFRAWLKNSYPSNARYIELAERRQELLDALPSLRGKNLACWCKPGSPCHADVLLEIANQWLTQRQAAIDARVAEISKNLKLGKPAHIEARDYDLPDEAEWNLPGTGKRPRRILCEDGRIFLHGQHCADAIGVALKTVRNCLCPSRRRRIGGLWCWYEGTESPVTKGKAA